jgi:hypothetical protein
LESAATDEQRATLCRLTERLCVVFQTLATSPHIEFAIEQIG